MIPRRKWWSIFAACTGVVLLALVWFTVILFQLEQGENAARAESQRQESVRLALWRMDSWLTPRLARESARPYFEYQSFFPQERSYTRLLYQIEPGELLLPSPLLSFQSDYIRLHFQMSPLGVLSSPQAPVGNLRELAEGIYISTESIDSYSATLAHIGRVLGVEQVVSCMPPTDVVALTAVADPVLPRNTQALRTIQEWTKRKDSYLRNIEAAYQTKGNDQRSGRDDAQVVTVGSLVPFWIDFNDTPSKELVFMRRVRFEGEEYFQGFLCHWDKLRDVLQNEIGDLFAGARLEPVSDDSVSDTDRGLMLAAIPVSLQIPPAVAAQIPLFSPVRATAAVTWLAVLAAIVAVAVTLRQSIAFGEKRSRFATAVTHELRTPLTTFRMYAEMLADGMVRDETQRQSYLETLKDESNRLATLVENVLSYAQLEEGRRVGHSCDISVENLLAKVKPPLVQRAEAAGMMLSFENAAPVHTIVHTDADAFGQILFNLVDNACKYACDVENRSIHLRMNADNRQLCTTVLDHGAGIPADRAALIFKPFERGANGNSDQPGIGLGLALSLGLARDLGGNLTLRSGSEYGAHFELTLPLRS